MEGPRFGGPVQAHDGERRGAPRGLVASAPSSHGETQLAHGSITKLALLIAAKDGPLLRGRLKGGEPLAAALYGASRAISNQTSSFLEGSIHFMLKLVSISPALV